MNIVEESTFAILNALVEQNGLDFDVLKEKSGLDWYNFNNAFDYLINQEMIVMNVTGDVREITITTKGLKYMLKDKAEKVKTSIKNSEATKTVKVVGRLVGKNVDKVGGELNKATDKLTDYLIKKGKELEAAKQAKQESKPEQEPTVEETEPVKEEKTIKGPFTKPEEKEGKFVNQDPFNIKDIDIFELSNRIKEVVSQVGDGVYSTRYPEQDSETKEETESNKETKE